MLWSVFISLIVLFLIFNHRLKFIPMISSVLKDHKAIYNAFYEAGKLYSVKNMTEQDSSNSFDKGLWQHFSKAGMHGLLAGKAHGGKEFSVLKTAIAYEAMAHACENNGLIFSSIAHLAACVTPLSLYGTASQKDTYLKKMTGGKWIAANAITELDSGSDVYNMSTVAVKSGNNYVLNGEKHYITNAPISDVLVIYALTDKTKGFFGGVSCFIVRSNTKGIKITKPKDKMGLRTAQMGHITLKNVKVSVNDMVGKPGAGGQIFNNSMLVEKVLVAAFLTGQLDRVLKSTIVYTKKRKLNNKRLFEIQNIQHKLADVATVLNAGKQMVYKAAHHIDTKHKNALTDASMAKLFVSEQVVNALKQLQEIYGAYGYLTEAEIEREYRDSYAALIYSGTSAIQRNIIAGSF